LLDLVDGANDKSRGPDRRGRAARGDQRVSHSSQLARDLDQSRLVLIAHAEKYLARRRHRLARSEVRLYESFSKRCAHSHDFARGLHLRAEYGVRAWKLDEREHRFLDGIVARDDFSLDVLLR